MHTSGLGVSVPVCKVCFSSVLQASTSVASCLGVLDPRGLEGLFGAGTTGRSLLSECWGEAAGAEDVLGAGFSFFTNPTYQMGNFIMFGWLNICLASYCLVVNEESD